MKKLYVGKMGYENLKHILTIFYWQASINTVLVYVFLRLVSHFLYTQSPSPNMFLDIQREK